MLGIDGSGGAAVARLEIKLLGGFEVLRDGAPVIDFESNTARALLAYLACEPGRGFSRAMLSEMLWPDRPEGAALSNLRHVLSVLRRILGDPVEEEGPIVADRSSVFIRDSADVRVDVVEFARLAAAPTKEAGAVDKWHQAADLWRGPFLDGVDLRGGAEWDEWVMVAAERLRRDLVSVLRRLADHHQRSGEPNRALRAARRLVEINPWDEQDHRRLLRLLAAMGDRTGALSHYEGLVHRLSEELGMAPSQSTEALAEQIHAGEIAAALAEIELSYPSFLSEVEPPVSPLFVGRETELARLRSHLGAALAGRGRVVLVEGEAGSGKTMLANEFAHRTAGELSDLLVGRGRCNAYGGLGDPYLPFREMLGMLTGDAEGALAAGLVDREQATRLWETIPISVRLTGERGPSLLGVMLNPLAALDRAEQAIPGADWLETIRRRAELLAERPPLPERMQPVLFDEYFSVLEGISLVHPVLLIVDDLQWADRGSVALLWHLARRLEGQKILVLGLYRPEEIATEHPLASVLGELRAAMPESTITLGEDRDFIDALVDSEPNDLDQEFRDGLFSFTGGHPLYTMEMVRGMQERGEIRRTRAGVWIAVESLDWLRLPDRVEAVIAQRIGRLPKDLRRDLEVAAVQGEEFIAETVEAVRDDPGVSARLRVEGSSPHRLIAPVGASRIDDRLAARHRFRHILFQRYLYGRLDSAEQMELHEATARALEDLYSGHPELPVVDLAHHFDAAGLLDPAIDYLHRAGQRAYAMSANEESIDLLQRARTLLAELPESAERDERELALLVALIGPLMAEQGYVGPDVGPVALRVRELCDRVEPSPLVAMALMGLARFIGLQGRFAESEAVAREVQVVSGEIGAPGLGLAGAWARGYNLFWMGEVDAGHEQLRQAWTGYDPVRDAALRHMIGTDPMAEALAWDAIATWLRGYPNRAVEMAERTVAWAKDIDHAITLCHALCVGSFVHRECGDYPASLPWAEEAGQLAAHEHFPFWQATSAIHRGIGIGHLGDPTHGIELIEQGLEEYRAMGVPSFHSLWTCDLSMLDRRLGATDRGLQRCEGAIADAEADRNGFARLRAGLTRAILLTDGEPEAAIEALEQAIEVTHQRGARWFELEAATELAVLLERMGRRAEARHVLEPVLGLQVLC
jgi:DNA-binding SARP family transcriptional activator